MENIVVNPKKIKDRLTISSGNSTPRYILKRIESKALNRYLYIHVYSSIIYNTSKVKATQVSMDRWMNRQKGDVCTMEYYSALKKKEYANTWMTLEGVLLSEISLSLKEK